MGRFHSNNGLCFERLHDGSVEVTDEAWDRWTGRPFEEEGAL